MELSNTWVVTKPDVGRLGNERKMAIPLGEWSGGGDILMALNARQWQGRSLHASNIKWERIPRQEIRGASNIGVLFEPLISWGGGA